MKSITDDDINEINICCGEVLIIAQHMTFQCMFHFQLNLYGF